jgi:hypothetical protein
VLKETPSRFENHNPFGKGMITGKATGRWTSASDFQSYCPLKNVGSPQLNIQCKETSRTRFLYPECSWGHVRIHHTHSMQHAHTWPSMSQSTDVLASKYVCQARFYTSCSFHSGPFRISHLSKKTWLGFNDA